MAEYRRKNFLEPSERYTDKYNTVTAFEALDYLQPYKKYSRKEYALPLGLYRQVFQDEYLF